MNGMPKAALDRWLTTDPWADEVGYGSPECVCGERMGDPVKVVYEEDTMPCNGKVVVVRGRYGDSPLDEGLLRIIGEDNRGKAWEESYPACPEYGDKVEDHPSHDIVYQVRQILTFRCGKCAAERTVVSY